MSVARTVRMTFFSCSTLLCLRLCIRAVGVVSGSAVRNTAMPRTRWGGLRSSISMSSARGTSVLRVLSKSSFEPRSQVHMVRISTMARITGT